MAPAFHSTCLGRERLPAALSIPRHHHRDGYIAVVLAGGYQEAGLAGRIQLKAGDVAVHGPFDAHLDHVGRGGADVLNLPLPPGARLPALYSIADPDAIARTAERDPLAAVEALVPGPTLLAANDWPDRLATAMSESADGPLRDWADRHGLAAETLSRGFRRAYGVTPARFRLEARARRAVHLIETTRLPLAAIAADCGFADQPHLTRAVHWLTGRPPGHWRRSISFKTGSDAAR